MGTPLKDAKIPENASNKLLLDKHISYIKSYEEKKEDYEYIMTEYLRMSGIYWGLTVMAFMKKIDIMNKDNILDFVKSCKHSCGGYSASVNHDPHLLYTLSAIQILALYDELDRIDKDKVAEYISNLQQPDGSFFGDKWGEVDSRFSFCALASLKILGKMDCIDVDKAVSFIVRCMNFDGGFGVSPGSESHAGQIYCCVGALSITNSLHRLNPDLLGWWLCERQLPSGGLNGRPEKLPDVCYSWWVLASLKVLGKINWIDKVDPFHTLFGIAGLSLLGYAQDDLEEVDPVFCLPRKKMCYFQTMTLILIASEVIHISSSELPFLNENLVMWNTSSIADSVLSATMATNTSHLNSTHLTSKSNKFENTSNATASSSENDGKPVRFSLVMFIALVIFIPVTVFGNGFVIIVISLSPYLRSQNTYIYLASLATVDFFIGLVSMPMKAKVSWDNGYFYMSEGACYFYHLFDIFLNTASLLHLFVIAVDRFLAIRYSFKYSSRMTSKLMTSTIISTWILAIVLSLLSIFNWDKSGANKQTLSIFLSAQNSCAHWNNVYFTFIAAVIFLTPLATMLFVYSYLYSVTVSQLRNIAMLNVQDSQHTKDKKLKQQQHRALTSILIIFLVYCICWGPSMIFMLVIFWGADASHWRSLASKLWFEITYFIVINLLTSLNSTTNPFIYVISNKTFRFSCQNVCLKLSRKYLSRHFNLSPIRPSMRLNSYMGSRENTTTNAYPAVSPAELKVESTETLNTVKPAVSLSYFDSTIINTNATGLHFDNSISKL